MHDIRRGQEKLGEHKAALLAAAERLDGPVIIVGLEPEAVEHVFDAVIHVVGVVIVQQLVQPVVAGGKRAALLFIGRFR